ncbi:GNAT family N-acetyltransferase [Paenibacillus sp. PL91]|uniref:GNAT family N-acetyltransferase n=1 Tax=Paenibacillus sp. PL91 TaxID=2729538 RepID=UPI00145CD7C8|nr:GNAT family N-acetyltransferase [Paenibacillus sp. PL91]MBC9205187.1 GNAT family N-acetyltransferase [Paenibacillus sp. PL91]
MTIIKLHKITKELESECTKLSVSSQQIAMVASNADSLIHATNEPTSVPYGILSDGMMVGFILFDNEVYKDGYYWILRFMIDERFQGKGYGKLSIKEVIKMLSERVDCKQIRVSHIPHNIVANKLYKDLGFVETGELEGNGDIILTYFM